MCEGEVTERLYFEDLRRELRATLIDIEIADTHGVPMTLVDTACDRKRSAAARARREGDQALLYDEVWCVFDIDEHPKVAAACDKAAANGVAVAVSNPSFELWALLHFQDQTAHIERGEVRSKLKEHLPRYEKRLPSEALKPGYDDARRRASQLGPMHASAGSPEPSNPSTTVWRLVERIHKEAKDGAT